VAAEVDEVVLEVDGVVEGVLALGVVVALGVVLLDEPGLTAVEAQALLLTPLDGFFEGIPGTLSVLPIQSLSQLVPGLAFSSSGNVMPKLSAILTP
jgi:hypothetical protein